MKNLHSNLFYLRVIFHIIDKFTRHISLTFCHNMFFFISFVKSFDNSYCQPPYPPYKPNIDADLVQVQVLTRHGARTPLHLSKNYSNRWTCKYNEIKSTGTEFLQPYTVHIAYGNSLYRGNCVFGQLLHTGSNGLKYLGKYLRKIYIDQLKFIPTQIDPKIIKFRTTQSHRTLHSQMSLVSGMFPFSNKVDIHMADKNYDPWRRTSLLCPRFAKIQSKILDNQQLKNKTLQNKLSQELNVKWDSTNDVMTSALCNNYKLPSNITMKDVDAAIELKAKQLQYFYSHSDVYPLFFSFCASEMVNEMIKRVNGNSSLRFIHWSAHDGNILGYLGLLGFSDNKWPPYGSYIITELLKFRGNGTFIVQFRYNGKLLKIPRFNNASYVTLDKYTKFLSESMPKYLEKCDFNITKFSNSDSLYIAY